MSFAADFVAQVEERIADALHVEEPARRGSPSVLAEASLRLCGAGGAKRFRPQLSLLLGQIYDLPMAPLIRVAAGAEMVHAASLLHDDVIDLGTERRGRPTANVQWGNSVAILAGDWLLTRAILEIAPLGIGILREAIETVATMTGSAVREVEARGRTDLTTQDWREIARGKAGELFAWCGRSVAELGQAPEAVEVLGQLGRRLGVAFQMADDLKDVLDPQSGKDRFADLKNRNPSFVLVVAMDRDPVLRQRIGAAWASPEATDGREVIELGRAIRESGAIQAADKLLREEVRESLSLLATVAPKRIVDEFVDLATSFAGDQIALLKGAA
jgi:heptaprenyl diphosphate synthase